MKNKKTIKKATKKEKRKMSKKAKIILAVVLSLVVFLTAGLFVVDSFAPASPKPYHRWVISTFNGSYDAEGKPKTSYQIEVKTDKKTGKLEYSCINTKISTTNTENVKEIWISISDLYEKELNVVLSKGWEGKSEFLTERTFTKSDVRRNADGWFKVYNNTESGLEYNKYGFYGQLRLSFSANVKVREIVVVDVYGIVGTVTVDHCSNGPRPYKDLDKGFAAVHNSTFKPADMNNVCDEKSLVSKEVNGEKGVFVRQ